MGYFKTCFFFKFYLNLIRVVRLREKLRISTQFFRKVFMKKKYKDELNIKKFVRLYSSICEI